MNLMPQPPRPTPPLLAERLLAWCCAPELLEEVQGDLHERFHRRLALFGERSARRQYVWEVLGFITKPFAIKRRSAQQDIDTLPSPILVHPAMIRNYVKIAWRNIAHNKTFSAINILGLALGMACSLLILLWIQDELSVDSYHANGPQLYHVMQRQSYDGKVETGRFTPGVLPDELKKQFPEIVHAAGYTGWDARMTFAVGDKINKESGHWAGADWFKMFSIPLLAGTPATALSTPNSLAISRKVAEFYFGEPTSALGKSIRIDNKTDYQVTAVFENLPANSSDTYDFLLNWQDCITRNPWMKEWGNNGPHTRIQVRPDANVAALNAKLKPFLRKYNKEMGRSFDAELFLHALPDAYLYSNFKNGQQDGGRIEYVRLFGIVAAFLLLIACINFMNLATARSVKRAREVGVRKVVGAMRSLLVGQFIGEALLLTSLALLIGLGFIYLILPSFNSLTGKHISLQITDVRFWLMLGGITVVTGLLAGSYPALFLSSLNPVRVLKGALKFGSGARLFRQGLVVFQFVLSTLLIIGTIVVYRQVNFIQTKNLGYDRENLLYVPVEGDLATQSAYKTFRDELLRLPGIASVSSIQEAPHNIGSSTGGVNWPGKDPNVLIEFTQTSVGYDVARTMQLKISGRDFSPAFSTDTTNYLINQTAARRIGYKDPVGQPLTMWGRPGKIIGVIEDFHFQSLHTPIAPLIFRLSTEPSSQNFMIRTQSGQTQQALASIERVWKQMNPKFPFAYRFADEEYTNLYKSETVVGSLANYFAFLAIFISCLGLFGLAAFTAEQRTKEIGVRKVLGATVTNIITLLSADFLKLVLIAILIASPLAWYAMNRWMQNFEYKIGVEWWVFAAAGILAVVIALLTISFQSIRAALMNPVKSLRSE
ncbi:ABC transporter permease [Fibrisoma montanum]|uniref:ABC transporter permease n=2 Tax=Fibrisoma montanum TaxID=2305895 RepID=A0A418M650_9BACT|nr:ABC transporter permease [Fibrisoma montanum]